MSWLLTFFQKDRRRDQGTLLPSLVLNMKRYSEGSLGKTLNPERGETFFLGTGVAVTPLYGVVPYDTGVIGFSEAAARNLISIRTVGGISGVVYENKSDKHIFVPPGVMLNQTPSAREAGRQQPRITSTSSIIPPGIQKGSGLVCAYSGGETSPVQLSPASQIYVIPSLRRLMMDRPRLDQQRVWEYIRRLGEKPVFRGVVGPKNDLYLLLTHDQFRRAMEDYYTKLFSVPPVKGNRKYMGNLVLLVDPLDEMLMAFIEGFGSESLAKSHKPYMNNSLAGQAVLSDDKKNIVAAISGQYMEATWEAFMDTPVPSYRNPLIDAIRHEGKLVHFEGYR